MQPPTGNECICSFVPTMQTLHCIIVIELAKVPMIMITAVPASQSLKTGTLYKIYNGQVHLKRIKNCCCGAVGRADTSSNGDLLFESSRRC